MNKPHENMSLSQNLHFLYKYVRMDKFTNQTTECGKCTAFLETREILKGTIMTW